MIDLFARIEQAHRLIRPQVAVTPLAHSPILSRLTGCRVYLKCEHLQHTGSFKFRGASNKLRLLGADACRNGVLSASSGNHGQGVALAGKLAGLPVTVYAARSAAAVKLESIRALGAEVVLLDETALAVEQIAERAARQKNMAFVHPYNDLDVIAGHGTIGMELHEQAAPAPDDLAAVFVAVGGGGLISGIGTALRALRPQTEIVGCWAANSTPLYSSLQAGMVIDVEESDTVADGITGGVEPGAVTFDIARQVIGKTALVPEPRIGAAMRLLAESDRWMVEGAAGVALAAMLEMAPQYQGRAVAVVLCGRNIMLSKFVEAVK